jgi:hypothetical protein
LNLFGPVDVALTLRGRSRRQIGAEGRRLR